ncbi:MAG: Trm112 family protein [Deltaproteobacteria bacterium]|nr:Trm112 family protein [Deltaproteobacteria bacterium]
MRILLLPPLILSDICLLLIYSEELLNILACPKCKGDLYLNETKDGLICDKCKLLYEIRDDIPIMLIDEAKPIEKR